MRRALLAAVAGLVLAAPSAQAAQLTVTTTADAPGVCVDGACPTLRAALAAAGDTAETDAIQVPAGDYALVLGELAVPGGVTITGASARTTVVHGPDRVLNVAAGAVAIAHMTVGGGVLNGGTLSLDRVRVTGGPGIANNGSLTLGHSLVDGNPGGGVLGDGSVTATDSTVALNEGGGIVGGTGTLTRVTIAGNGGVNLSGALHLRGSLLDRCGPGLISDGNNALPFLCGITPALGDLFGQDAKLGTALVNAGGETDVLRLAPGSKAVGVAGECTGTDQRELPRPQGPACDAGAYELEVVQVTGPDGPTRAQPVTFGFQAAPGSTFRCTLDADEDPCISPVEYPGLAQGAHTFTVQAFDGDLPVSEPVTREFTLDTIAPDARITSAPPALGRLNDVSFSFTADEEVAFTCRLDDGAFAACVSGQPYDDVADGSHTFTLRATDLAGNVTELSQDFAIDTDPPDAPTVTTPRNGDVVTTSPIAFAGTVAEPGFVSIFEETTLKGRVQTEAGGSWHADVLAEDGTHTYDAKLEDAAGNFSDATTVTVTVDANAPAAPSIDSPAEGSAQRSTTVALAGRTEPGAKVAVTEGTDARGEATANANGGWTLDVAGVAEGVHAYTATATDTAGHTGPASASAPRSVRVDLTPPAPAQVSGGADGFTLVAPEPDAALACGLDGGGLAPCASGLSFPGLAPGEHVLTVRATDAAGNESTIDYRFTVARVVVGATPTPTATPVATPSYRKIVVLRPQSGRTFVRRPGEKAFTEIRSRTAVAVGTTVNVKQGAVIVIAASSTATETAKFSGGIFTASGTDLTLSETLRCGRARRLTGDGAGAFRIRGHYASATGRGAKWTVEDTCKQTRIRVLRGVVAVLDKRRTKTLLIRSGRSYTARPKR